MDTVLQSGFYGQNMTVMRLLPPEIAFRYHALPIATDGRSVTVALAASSDQQALEAIQQVLDTPVCFVQADRFEIDRRLSQLWLPKSSQTQLLAWISGHEPDSFSMYAKDLAGLLDAELELIRIPLNHTCLQNLTANIQFFKPDLFLYSSCHPSRIIKSLMNSISSEIPEFTCLKVPTVSPWPISRILLVLPELEGGTDLAISWAGRLAWSTQALVTVLPVLPPLPLFYGSFLRHNLEEILTGNDPLGRRLQEISSQFREKEIIGIYRLRDGDPLYQVREEVLASDPDLIVIPAHLGKGKINWMTEDLGSILFKSSLKPLLTAVHIS